MDVAFSRNGVPIRLTDERWFHVVENHDDLGGYYDEVLQTARLESGSPTSSRSQEAQTFL